MKNQYTFQYDHIRCIDLPRYDQTKENESFLKPKIEISKKKKKKRDSIISELVGQ